jgi:lipopolysaccharide export system permease protein
MLFDSTLRRDLARNFGATLVVILTIVLTMMLIRTLGLAAGGRVAPQDVVLLLGYEALGHLSTMLSLSLFIAVVATLSRMYRDSEMVIWFASGAGLARFVRPVLQVSWPVLLAVALLIFFVWPWKNQHSTELKEQFERRSDLSRVAPGQFQSSRDGSRVFFIERDSADSQTARNIFILTTLADTEAVTSARSGRVEVQGDDRFLVLSKGQRNEQNMRTLEKTQARFDTYRLLTGEKVPSGVNQLPPKARPTLELLREPTPRHQGELVWRLGLFLGSANMLLLGIGLSATHPRRASNWNLLIALLSFVVYYNMINLSQSWVASEKFSLGTVLVAVHGGAFVGALALLWWREHRHLRWPRPRWLARA